MAWRPSARRQVLSAKRVFGEAIEGPDGALLLPVARLRGGAGGGHGPDGGKGAGEGGGFGVRAAPAGVYLLKGDRLRWVPTVDVNRVILGSQLVAACGLLAFGLSRLIPRRRFGFR